MMESGEQRALLRHRAVQRATRWRSVVVALLQSRHRGGLRRTGALIAACRAYNTACEELARQAPKVHRFVCQISHLTSMQEALGISSSSFVFGKRICLKMVNAIGWPSSPKGLHAIAMASLLFLSRAES